MNSAVGDDIELMVDHVNLDKDVALVYALPIPFKRQKLRNIVMCRDVMPDKPTIFLIENWYQSHL